MIGTPFGKYLSHMASISACILTLSILVLGVCVTPVSAAPRTSHAHLLRADEGDEIDPILNPSDSIPDNTGNASAGDGVDDGTDSPAACNDTVYSGLPLFRGQSRISCNGRYTLQVLANGNAVVNLNLAGGITLWNNGAPGDVFGPEVNGFGGIVDNSIYLPTTWAILTGIPIARVQIQDTGNLAAYGPYNNFVWQAGTNTIRCSNGVTLQRNDEYDALNRSQTKGASAAQLQQLGTSPCTLPSTK
jgi:hypothetical protein